MTSNISDPPGEPHGGSEPANMKTVARNDGGDWVITGSKMWITNGKLVVGLFEIVSGLQAEPKRPPPKLHALAGGS